MSVGTVTNWVPVTVSSLEPVKFAVSSLVRRNQVRNAHKLHAPHRWTSGALLFATAWLTLVTVALTWKVPSVLVCVVFFYGLSGPGVQDYQVGLDFRLHPPPQGGSRRNKGAASDASSTAALCSRVWQRTQLRLVRDLLHLFLLFFFPPKELCDYSWNFFFLTFKAAGSDLCDWRPVEPFHLPCYIHWRLSREDAAKSRVNWVVSWEQSDRALDCLWIKTWVCSGPDLLLWLKSGCCIDPYGLFSLRHTYPHPHVLRFANFCWAEAAGGRFSPLASSGTFFAIKVWKHPRLRPTFDYDAMRVKRAHNNNDISYVNGKNVQPMSHFSKHPNSAEKRTSCLRVETPVTNEEILEIRATVNQSILLECQCDVIDHGTGPTDSWYLMMTTWHDHQEAI